MIFRHLQLDKLVLELCPVSEASTEERQLKLHQRDEEDENTSHYKGKY